MIVGKASLDKIDFHIDANGINYVEIKSFESALMMLLNKKLIYF